MVFQEYRGNRKLLKRVRYITPQEFIEKLLPAVGDNRGAWMLFYVIANLGLRVSEAHRLTGGDFHEHTLTVSVHTAKKNLSEDETEETIVSKQFMSKIRGWITERKIKKDQMLFSWSKRRSQHLWDKYATKAGLNITLKHGGPHRGRGIHSLRYVKAIYLADNNAPAAIIRNQLRQESITSSEIYIETARESKFIQQVGSIG